MSNQPPALTDRQRLTIETLAKIRMAWVALWFALVLFSIAFVVFVVAIFTSRNAAATSIEGIIDGILAWILKIVYSHLFPPPKK